MNKYEMQSDYEGLNIYGNCDLCKNEDAEIKVFDGIGICSNCLESSDERSFTDDELNDILQEYKEDLENLDDDIEELNFDE